MSKTENNNLPAIDDVNRWIEQSNFELGDDRMQSLYVFNKRFDRQPPASWVKKNVGIKYIPIRIIEQMLRSIFGIYQVEWVKPPYLIGNSVVCAVHLKVYHPVLQEWLVYAGTGAVPVELKAEKVDSKTGEVITPGAKHAMDFEYVNRMALHKNAPSAKSFAVNNAAKLIGNVFGASLNAKADEVIPMVDTYETTKINPLQQFEKPAEK